MSTSPRASPVRPPASPGQGAASPAGSPIGAPPAAKKSGSEVLNRVVFTLLMAYSFLALVSCGARYVIPVVMAMKAMMFIEVLRIRQKERKERQLPLARFLPYYFLVVTLITVAAVAMRDQVVATWPWTASFYDFSFMLSFGAYMAGFVIFVLTLRRSMLRYQMGQFTWMAMTIFFIIVQGGVMYSNMLRGMFWFLFPVSCVVHNDVWAYACGKLFGKTQLLALSPRKTLEGFLGSWVMTMVWGVWFSGFMCRFPAFVCPTVDLAAATTNCTLHPNFVMEDVALALPPMVQGPLLGMGVPAAWAQMTVHTQWAPIQKHGLFLATFASLLAPFGGFFASGLKRAFKLKDFGDLIPGHGGMTDRMDCQVINAMFTWVYATFVVYGLNAGKCPAVPDLVACLEALPEATRAAVVEAAMRSLGAAAAP